MVRWAPAVLVLVVACSGATSEAPRDGGAAVARDGGAIRDAGSADAGASCDAPLLQCGPDCVDPMTSVRHCGECGELCLPGEECIVGTCSEPFVAVERYGIPDDLMDCDTGVPFWSERLAVDRGQRIYLGLICDGDGYMATSTDRGRSFELRPLGLSEVQGFKVIAGEAGEAHIAAVTGPIFQGVLVYQRTMDGGAIWSPPRPVDLGPVFNAPYGFSSAFRIVGDDVYITSRWVDQETTLRFWRAEDRGAAPFTLTSTVNTMMTLDADLIEYDGALLFLSPEDQNVHGERIMRSDDRAESFYEVETKTGVGGRTRRLVGDRMFFTIASGGVGYYDLDTDTSNYNPGFARETNTGASIGALAPVGRNTAYLIINNRPPLGDDYATATERLYRYDAEQNSLEELALIENSVGLGAPSYPFAYANTHLLTVPGTNAILMALSRRGSVTFEVLVP